MLHHRGFLILGRLSFCLYLIHIEVIRYILGVSRSPKYWNYFLFNSLALSVIIISLLISLVFVLCIEMPFISLMKLTIPIPQETVIVDYKNQVVNNGNEIQI